MMILAEVPADSQDRKLLDHILNVMMPESICRCWSFFSAKTVENLDASSALHLRLNNYNITERVYYRPIIALFC